MSRTSSYVPKCMLGLSLLLALALSTPCVAQFVTTDNFDRPDGPVGLGWSPWGNGAQISGNQLETFGQVNVAGGIERKLDVTFPLTFTFDFSTAAPSDGGWQIGFNSASAFTVGAQNTSEFGVFQNNGGVAVCVFFQTTSGEADECAPVNANQRQFTATAHISGTVNADLSTTITIKYNDGVKPNAVHVTTPPPTGAIVVPQGSILMLGNPNATSGPHFFDNFKLTLM